MQRRMWQTLNGGCGHFIHVLVVYRYLEYYLIVRAHMHKDALSFTQLARLFRLQHTSLILSLNDRTFLDGMIKSTASRNVTRYLLTKTILMYFNLV